MTSDKPTSLMPPLRFPEFRNAPGWPGRLMGDYLSESRIRGSGGHKAKKLTVKLWGKGVVEKHGSVQGSENTQYYRRRAGQFIYSKLDFVNQAFGIVPEHLDGFESTVDLPCFDIIPEMNSEFLLEYVRREQFYKIRGEIADGGRKAKRIQVETFLACPIYAPSEPEQQKVADCLGSLDDLIAAEGRKLAGLRQHKRGLLWNLFPQEGNAEPAVRFLTYRNAKAWNVTRLGDIADYENGKAYEKDIVDDGRFIVVNARFISTDGAVRKYSNETYCIAQTGDVLMVLSDLPSAKALARCFLVDADDTYAVNQRVAKLRPRSVDSKFLLYALDKHPWLMAFSDGINQTHLSIGAVLDCPVAVPRDGSEQAHIAECLGTVDSQVTAQEAKLAALTRHKHGLLEQLFPSLEEASR